MALQPVPFNKPVVCSTFSSSLWSSTFPCAKVSPLRLDFPHPFLLNILSWLKHNYLLLHLRLQEGREAGKPENHKVALSLSSPGTLALLSHAPDQRLSFPFPMLG